MPTEYQKRVPEKRPEWLQTAVLKFPSGREAKQPGEPKRMQPSRARSDT